MEENNKKQEVELKEVKGKSIAIILIALVVVFGIVLLVNYGLNKIESNTNTNTKVVEAKSVIDETNKIIDEGKKATSEVLNKEKKEAVDQTKGIKPEDNSKEHGSLIEEIDQKTFEEKLKAKEPMLVDFYATWCGPCQIMLPIAEQAKKEGVNIYKVNVDKEIDLTVSQGVRVLPTIVGYKDGKEFDRTFGVITKEKLKERHEKLNN